MEHNRFIRPWLIGVTISTLVFFGDRAGFLDWAELKSLDLQFQFRGALRPEVPIVLVSIDQDSFDELDLAWPWPRTLHATVIKKLAHAGARVIGVDILFTEPKPDSKEDQDLARAIESAGNVILASEFTKVQSAFGPKMSMSLPIPTLRDHALAYGPANVVTDLDGVVRSSLQAWTFQQRAHPSFGYQIYRQAFKKGAEFEKIPTDPILINFRGPARSYPIVPYYRIIRDEIDPSFFRDRIVLIGAFAPSLHDAYSTPFGASQFTSGVEIQASFIETLSAGNAIIAFRGWSNAAVLLVLAVLTIHVSSRLKPLKSLALVLAMAGGVLLCAFDLFSRGQLWMPVVPPVLAVLLTYGGITLDNYVREQKERIRLRATFARYVSPDVVEEILSDREGLGLGGRRRHITVLFSDIRGFTGIAEQIQPEEVVSLLSGYLARVAGIILKHGGTVDKFIGDAVMAIFGAPKSYGDDAVRALRAGIEIIEAAKSESARWEERIGHPLRVGVGINSGEAVVGSIGSEIRSDFTAIGDTVNLASRLESLTKELGVPVLISEQTAAEVKDTLPLRPLQRVRVEIGRAHV